MHFLIEHRVLCYVESIDELNLEKSLHQCLPASSYSVSIAAWHTVNSLSAFLLFLLSLFSASTEAHLTSIKVPISISNIIKRRRFHSYLIFIWNSIKIYFNLISNDTGYDGRAHLCNFLHESSFFPNPACINVNDIRLILALKMKSKESRRVRCEWR